MSPRELSGAEGAGVEGMAPARSWLSAAALSACSSSWGQRPSGSLRLKKRADFSHGRGWI